MVPDQTACLDANIAHVALDSRFHGNDGGGGGNNGGYENDGKG